MRLTRMLVALIAVSLSAIGCGAEAHVAPDDSPVVGVWALQSYSGHPLPYTGTPDGNAVNTATAGELSLSSAGGYSLHIAITRVVDGTQTSQADWNEVGTYARTPLGLSMRPFDVPGTVFTGSVVPATITGNTISFDQQGKTLTFAKR